MSWQYTVEELQQIIIDAKKFLAETRSSVGGPWESYRCKAEIFLDEVIARFKQNE